MEMSMPFLSVAGGCSSESPVTNEMCDGFSAASSSCSLSWLEVHVEVFGHDWPVVHGAAGSVCGCTLRGRGR